MSSIVENNVSNGIDFSSMPSGERYLFGLMVINRPIAQVSYTAGSMIWLGGHSDLDFSSINSVTATMRHSGASNLDFTLAIGTATQRYSFTNQSGTTWSTITQTLDITSLKNKTASFYLSWSSAPQAFELQIDSYTTTDGKVHTANNINY